MGKLDGVDPQMCHYEGKGNYEPVNAEHAKQIAAKKGEAWEGYKESLLSPRVVRYHCTYVCRDESPKDAPGARGDAYELDTLVEYTGHNTKDNASALCPGYVQTGSQINPQNLQNMPEMSMVPVHASNLRPSESFPVGKKARVVSSARRRTVESRKLERLLARRDSQRLRELTAQDIGTLNRETRVGLTQLALTPAGVERDFLRTAFATWTPVEAGEVMIRLDAAQGAALRPALQGAPGAREAALAAEALSARDVVVRTYPAMFAMLGTGNRPPPERFATLAQQLATAEIAWTKVGVDDLATLRPAMGAVLTLARQKGVEERDLLLLQGVSTGSMHGLTNAEEQRTALRLVTALGEVRSGAATARGQADSALRRLQTGSPAAQQVARDLAPALGP